jgi:tyrosinase
LYNAVQKVARRFPKGALRDRYLEAAKTFRAPYFDWASLPPPGSPAFPSALTSPKVQVVDVDGKTKLVNNPLYQYSFHRVNPSPGDFSRRVSSPLRQASPSLIHKLTLDLVEPVQDDSPVS